MTDLPDTMRALVLPAWGAPLELRELARPDPGPGEVLIRLAASPINPSDLMTLKGLYSVPADPPLVPGLEGAGQVVAAGAGVLPKTLMGKRVACASAAGGLWAEYIVLPFDRVVTLPPDLPLGRAAMSAVNPLTAIALIDEARRRGHRAVVSTAAAGQLGRMIRRRGAEKGVEIINIVRRAAQVDALKAEGARHVLDETAPDFDAGLKTLCTTLNCRMALDAVGGQMTFRLLEALGPRCDILIYGALSEAPATLHPGTMIFKEARVEGFWLSQWLPRKSLPAMLWTLRQATRALKGGFAESRIARIVDLAEAADAPAAYAAGMSAGKTLIRLSDADLGVAPGS